MRDFLVNLVRDGTAGPTIEMYNACHLGFIAALAAFTAFMALFFRKKSAAAKKSVLDWMAFAIISLYFTDFLVHPLLENADILIVDKLPFHLCTSMGILLALTRLFPKQLDRLKDVPVILGFIGAVFYLVAPSGVTGHSMFCYRTLQTLIYHGLFCAYGLLSMIYGDIKPCFSKIWKTAVTVVLQIGLALLANAAYSVPEGNPNSGAHVYNWYFVGPGTNDLFGTSFSSALVPFITFGVIMLMAVLVYGAYYLALFISHKINKKA